MAIRVLLSRKLGEVRWTQADLSRATGIRKATIWEMYNELSKGIQYQHLDRICAALNCDVSEILEYIPDDEVNVRTRAGNKKTLPKGKAATN